MYDEIQKVHHTLCTILTIMKAIRLLLIMLSVAITVVAKGHQLPEDNLIPVFKNEGKAASNRADEQSEVIYLDVTLAHAGELTDKLGDDTSILDSLVVRGPVNEADFRAMFLASLDRKLSVINLEYAILEGGKVPDSAFWDTDEQLIPGTINYYCVFLRRIIFPEGLTEIGVDAFTFAKRLETINIPSTLKDIRDGAFSYCKNLSPSLLVFPDGMTEIGEQAFEGCNDLWDKEKNHWKELEVVIPSSVRTIAFCAFKGCHVSNLVLSEGITNIGKMAFYGHCLKEFTIPESCKDLGEYAFANSYDLERVTLPEGLISIPEGFLYECREMKVINIPSTIVTIGNAVFNNCQSLTSLDLPEGLKEIGINAFRNCSKLTQLTFPASLERLGEGSCTSLRKIYCKAVTPPNCPENPNKTGYGPFGPCSNLVIDYPLYVPVGSSMKYRQAWGWSNFANVIETDDFPAGIEDVLADGVNEDHRVYDMSGRIVLNPIPGHLYIKGGKKFVCHE